jgi:insecticidal toxin complex protein TccC
MQSNGADKQDNGGARIEAHKLALPKGGGTAQGMGEAFAPHEFSGVAALSVPVFVSPSRGLQPALSLSYSAGTGNGVFGLGFSLSLSSISRRTSKAIPQYGPADQFLFDGDVLVPADPGCGPFGDWPQTRDWGGNPYVGTLYRPREEGAFSRIERWVERTTEGPEEANSFWRVITHENTVHTFGASDCARIANPDDPSQVFEWLLEEGLDEKGNAIRYQYKPEDTNGFDSGVIWEQDRVQTANRYIEKIFYGSKKPHDRVFAAPAKIDENDWYFWVIFDYGEYELPVLSAKNTWPGRKDPFSTYNAGFERRTHRLCRNILMVHNFADVSDLPDPVLTHAMCLCYEENPSLTRLKKIKSIGYRYNVKKGGYRCKSLPPLEVDYVAYAPTGHRFRPLLQDAKHPRHLVGATERPDYQLVDLYGEGVPGILYGDGRTVAYREPEFPAADGEPGISYSELQALDAFPIEHRVTGARHRLMEVTGNARLDLVLDRGFFEARPDHTWSSFRAFDAVPTDLRDSRYELADLTGDGLADLLVMEKTRVRYYPARGAQGYGGAQVADCDVDAPFSGSGNPKAAVLFADLLGAGLDQRVRIANGCVECWPNLGYGRFGKKITMGTAPRFGDDFDAARVRLVDLDGSGTADLIYINADRIDIYASCSGNSFSTKATSIPLKGRCYSPAQVSFEDVYGTGGACLIFADDDPVPRHWVYDFCQGRKPHLLERICNNRGASTRIHYASSTAYYLEDKRNGVAWITNPPFPVQVVKQIEHRDAINDTALVSSFGYRHGYYDAVEREFRGFAFVERADTGLLAKSPARRTGSVELLPPPGIVPPLITRTWYHTGAWLRGQSLPSVLKSEYFQGDHDAYLMPDMEFCQPPDPGTVRQAHAALHGHVLRQEVYAAADLCSGSGGAVPYTASENRFHVRIDQQKGENANGVFFVHDLEGIAYDYERNAGDPRISQSFTLAVDCFGNVTRACAAALSRRGSVQDSMRHAVPSQFSCKVQLSIDRYAPPVKDSDNWLEGLLSEEIELGTEGLEPATGAAYFDWEYLEHKIGGADIPGTLSSGLEILSWARHHYCETDGKVAIPARLISTDVAVLSKKAMADIFAGTMLQTDEDDLATFLETKGKYLKESKDEYWRAPGATAGYWGADKFYLVNETKGPFGETASYTYDTAFTHIASVKVSAADVLDTETKVDVFDYQALQPVRLIDANGIKLEVVLDPLGVVIASSEYKNATGFDPILKDADEWPVPESLDALVSDPKKYLRGAAEYFFYEPAYPVGPSGSSPSAGTQPPHIALLAAHDYPAIGDQRIAMGITYFDGFGRVVESKATVKPGKVTCGETSAAVSGAATVDPRWRASGNVRYNNKGLPYKKYEPFFSAAYTFEGWQIGVSATLGYDPLGRVVRTDLPAYGFTDGGVFTTADYAAWHETGSDANDTVMESAAYQGRDKLPQWDQDALNKAAVCAGTPTTIVFDNLGQTVRRIQRLAVSELDGPREFVTVLDYDIHGNQVSSADPRLSQAGVKNFIVAHDLAGRPVRTHSADAGTSWILRNAVGNPIYGYDCRLVAFTYDYDGLQRPTAVHVTRGKADNRSTTTLERTVYGDSLDESRKPKPPVKDPAACNLIGRPFIEYDEAGKVEFAAYDLAGGPSKATRRLRAAYDVESDWRAGNNGNWEDWLAGLDKQLEDAAQDDYVATYTYDAVGAVIHTVETATVGGAPTSYAHDYTYDVAGELDTIKLDGAAVVTAIDRNARGQRECVTYASKACPDGLLAAEYGYDPLTFELSTIATSRLQAAAGAAEKKLQNLTYYRDPVGNITHVKDDSTPVMTVFHNNQGVSPDKDYTYDSLYRLWRAKGRARKNLSQQYARAGGYGSFALNDDQALERYKQVFGYDDGGNLNQLSYQSHSSGWTNCLAVSDASNRAVNTDLLGLPAQPVVRPSKDIDKFFDAAGNQVCLGGLDPKLSSDPMTWNARGNIGRVTIVDRSTDDGLAVGQQDSDWEYYVYDCGGRRIRKVSVAQTSAGSTIEEVRYYGGLEVYTRKGGKVVEERHRIRVGDGDHVVAERLEWKKGAPSGVANPQVRYQLSDHLGSTTLEVDGSGRLISYEEYAPYGLTVLAGGSSPAEVKLKRYRYSGKERDKHTGLYYYGARYYAPWLGRWLSPDPAGTIDGLNLYGFVGGNPVVYADADGRVRIHHWNVKDKTAATLKSPSFVNSLAALADKASYDKGTAIFLTEIMGSVDDNDKDKLVKALNKKVKGWNGKLIYVGISEGGWRREQVLVLTHGVVPRRYWKIIKSEATSNFTKKFEASSDARHKTNSRYIVGMDIDTNMTGKSETLSIGAFHNLGPHTGAKEEAITWRNAAQTHEVNVVIGDWNVEPLYQEGVTFDKTATTLGGHHYDYALRFKPTVGESPNERQLTIQNHAGSFHKSSSDHRQISATINTRMKK